MVLLPRVLLALPAVVVGISSEAERSSPTFFSNGAIGSDGRKLRQASHFTRQAGFIKVHTSQAQRIDFFLDCEVVTASVALNAFPGVSVVTVVAVPASILPPFEINFARLRHGLLLIPILSVECEDNGAFEKSAFRDNPRVRLS